MSSVEAKNLWKIYGKDVVAVQDANFQCANEEFLAILGPSGCGKSSTLRMLAGLEDISKGEILFDDKVVNELSPRERNVALAFESYALYPPLTIFENLAFPLRAQGADRDEIEGKVRRIAEAFELGDVLNRKPGKLSGGQQQRVSLARALIRNPSVLLLDEPLSHMDQRLRAILRARIRRIHDELSTATIYVTHDQEEAVALADKIIIMNLGVIQQAGTVDDLWNRPANQFVAGFLGEPAMNFMKGKIEGKNQIALANADSSVSWKVSDPLSSIGGQLDVIVGIRPDKLKVSNKENDAGLKARVQVIEFQGDYLILTLKQADMEHKAIVQEGFSLDPDTDVWIWADPEDTHVFEEETGKALTKIP